MLGPCEGNALRKVLLVVPTHGAVVMREGWAGRAGQFGVHGPVAAPSVSDLLDEEAALLAAAPPLAPPAPPPAPPMPNLSRLSPFALAGPPAASLPASALALATSKLVGGLGLSAPNPAAEGLGLGHAGEPVGVWPGSPACADAAAAAFAPSDRMAQGLGFGRRGDLGGAAEAAMADAAAAAAAAVNPVRTFSGGGGGGGGGLAEDARSWSRGLLTISDDGGASPGLSARPNSRAWEARAPALPPARSSLEDMQRAGDSGYGRHRLSTHPAHSSAAAHAATIEAVASSAAAGGARRAQGAPKAPPQGAGAKPRRGRLERHVRIASAPELAQGE